MLATNPVDPNRAVTIQFLGTAGPAEAYPREGEPRLTAAVGLAAAASVLAIGVAAAAFAGASAVSDPAAPVAKAPARAPEVVVDHRIPGEFRLAPGNNTPPGVVVRLGVPSPFPGDFRLAPGNNTPPGLVGAGMTAPTPGDFHLAPGNDTPPGLVSAGS